MFGLFGKSTFDAEMASLQDEYKNLGAQMLIAMNGFQLEKQMSLLRAMASTCEKMTACCRKHGKHQEAVKWEEAKQKALALHG